MTTNDGPIVLFDGVCTLCDRSVQFILDHDPAGAFRFASLQSEVGRQLLQRCGLEPGALDSVVLVEGDRCLTRSDGALGIARHLSRPWRWLAIGRWAPRILRDAVYDGVARNRYRWFGTREACRLPTPDLRARFLDADELTSAAGLATPARAS